MVVNDERRYRRDAEIAGALNRGSNPIVVGFNRRNRACHSGEFRECHEC